MPTKKKYWKTEEITRTIPAKMRRPTSNTPYVGLDKYLKKLSNEEAQTVWDTLYKIIPVTGNSIDKEKWIQPNTPTLSKLFEIISKSIIKRKFYDQNSQFIILQPNLKASELSKLNKLLTRINKQLQERREKDGVIRYTPEIPLDWYVKHLVFQANSLAVLSYKDLSLDLKSGVLTLDGVGIVVNIDSEHIQLLSLLIKKQGGILSNKEIQQAFLIEEKGKTELANFIYRQKYIINKLIKHNFSYPANIVDTIRNGGCYINP